MSKRALETSTPVNTEKKAKVDPTCISDGRDYVMVMWWYDSDTDVFFIPMEEISANNLETLREAAGRNLSDDEDGVVLKAQWLLYDFPATDGSEESEEEVEEELSDEEHGIFEKFKKQSANHPTGSAWSRWECSVKEIINIHSV